VGEPSAAEQDGGPEDDALDAARRRAASAVSRLGHVLAGHEVAEGVLLDLADRVDELVEQLGELPLRDKRNDIERRARWGEYRRTGVWPGPVPDGDEITFDRSSFVGGVLSPFAMGATFHREGDEAVGRVTMGPAFEGPPGRVHGGAIAAMVDEVMGSVNSVLGTVAFTGRLSVSFVGPCPLGTELEFRAGLVERDGRKLHLACTGRAGETVFARAEATFVEIDPAVALSMFEA